MARVLKIYKDAKRRNKTSIKKRRNAQIKTYLGVTLQEHQTIRFKNYCQVTTAAKSYYSQFALSRHSLRKYASFGLMPGVMKASW